MTIVHLLEKNAREFPNDVALVEINPEQPETRRITWSEFELVESSARRPYRREITWSVFEEKANRFANMLSNNGIGKGNKVAILLMNCIDWLPIYFGILKTGALVVPLNVRQSSDEIDYCLDLAEADVLVFGNEFVGRVEAIADKISKRCKLIYFGASCPAFADDYNELVSECSSSYHGCWLEESDDAAIYFSSGTTGFPKAILHNHESLIFSCKVEQAHHGQTKDDCFLCIPPLSKAEHQKSKSELLLGTALADQWLRLRLLRQGMEVHIPGQGARIPQALWPKKQNIKKRNGTVTNSTKTLKKWSTSNQSLPKKKKKSYCFLCSSVSFKHFALVLPLPCLKEHSV